MNTHPSTADSTTPAGSDFPTHLHDQFLEPRSIPANWDTSEMLVRIASRIHPPTVSPAEGSPEGAAVEPAETGPDLSLSERTHESFPESNFFPAHWELS